MQFAFWIFYRSHQTHSHEIKMEVGIVFYATVNEDVSAEAYEKAAAALIGDVEGEAGCRAYRWLRSAEDPREVVVHEFYDSDEALLAHFAQPKLAATLAHATPRAVHTFGLGAGAREAVNGFKVPETLHFGDVAGLDGFRFPGPAGGAPTVGWVLELKLNDGKTVDDVREVSEHPAFVPGVRGSDSEKGTLYYRWCADDGGRVFLIELFADSAANLAHMANVGAALPALFGVTTPQALRVVGAHSDEARAAIAGLPIPTIQFFADFAGFDFRPPQ